MCDFADDTTSHSSGFDRKQVMIDVEHYCSLLVEWLVIIYLNVNAEKYHLLVTRCAKCEAMSASMGEG